MYKFSVLLSALLLSVVCAGPTFAATGPLDPTGDDTGFIPPSIQIGRCERYMNKRVLLAAVCTMQCHFKQVGMIFKNLPFDEEACEDGAIKTSCKSKYDKALALIKPGECPPCLDAPGQQALYTTYRDIAESLNPMVYCDSTTANVPFGGDDAGFSPLQVDVKKCEDKFGKNVMKLAKCISKCHRLLADDAFTGAPFNEEDCEETDPVNSCKARFFAANSLLHGCPACIDQEAVFAAIEQAFDTHNGDIYCAQ